MAHSVALVWANGGAGRKRLSGIPLLGTVLEVISLNNASAGRALVKEIKPQLIERSSYVIADRTGTKLLLAKALARHFCESDCILYISETDVWPSLEIDGFYERIRKSEGLEPDFRSLPVESIPKNNQGYLSSALAIAVMSLWSFYLLDVLGSRLVFHSHDTIIWFYSGATDDSFGAGFESIGMRPLHPEIGHGRE